MNLARLIRDADKVYLIGNGGSAANAIHIANDLVSVGVPATPLCADVATMTAIANDYSYAQVFARQIDVHGQEGDLLIALSGSGKSTNILRAVNKAKRKFMVVIGITGAYELKCPLARSAHHAIRYGRNMQEAENYQIQWGHEIMKALRKS